MLHMQLEELLEVLDGDGTPRSEGAGSESGASV
jgi:hypothetical protein